VASARCARRRVADDIPDLQEVSDMDARMEFDSLEPDWSALLDAAASVEEMARDSVAASQSLSPQRPRPVSEFGSPAVAGALSPTAAGSGLAASSAARTPRAVEPVDQPGSLPRRAHRAETAAIVPAWVDTVALAGGEAGISVTSHRGNWNATLRFCTRPAAATPGGVLGLVWCGPKGKWAGVVDILCQRCDLRRGFGDLTPLSQRRAHRRLQRICRAEPYGTRWGTGAIICIQCAAGDFEGSKAFLNALAIDNIVRAELTLRLRVSDQNMVPVDETVTLALGKDSQKKMEQELYRRGAQLLRSHFQSESPGRRTGDGGAESDTDDDDAP
jgi:hypothetical protein